MTDSQKNVNEKTPKEVFLTKPLPPSRVKIVESSDQVDFEGVCDLKAQQREYYMTRLKILATFSG